MQIYVNGEPKTAQDSVVLSDLIATLVDDPRGVAIELNREIVPKSAYGATPLREGDRLEIVQFVGGG